jgi:hypothetical protein
MLEQHTGSSNDCGDYERESIVHQEVGDKRGVVRPPRAEIVFKDECSSQFDG